MSGLPLQRPTPQELRAWLFDKFLEEEKPELAKKNRVQLFEDLNKIPAKEAGEKLKEYGEAIADLAAKFPAFLKRQTKELEKMMGDMQKHSKETDEEDLSRLEDEISSLDDA